MAELTIDGDMFNVEVDGLVAKPALVLSNALGMVLTMWEPQMTALRRHFRIVRYDSRGHGGSSGRGGPFSIGRLGRDVLAIMDALEIERAHFVGISMGGAVGQWLLANAPLRIERAVLASTAPRLSSPASWNAHIATVLSGDMKSDAGGVIERWFSDGFRQANPKAVEATENKLVQVPPGGYAASCAALRDMDLRQALYRVRHPVLVITGTDDPVISAEDIAALTSALRNVRHVALRAKHICNIEAADAFSDAIVEFLTSRVPVRGAETRSMPARSTRMVGSARQVGTRTTGRRPAIKSKPGGKSAPPVAKRSMAIPAVKKAASKKVPSRRGRSAATPTRTETRKPVKSATAAPRKGTKSKGGTQPVARRQATAPTKAKAGSADRARIAQKTTASSAKTSSSKSSSRAAKVAAKAGSPRRPTPLMSARNSKPAARQKAPSGGTATRKPAQNRVAAKPPSARRKPPTGPRRPGGRGKP